MKTRKTASPQADLLDALARFRTGRGSGVAPHGFGLFSYCAVTRERLASIRLERPVLGVVLSGAKEVWRGLGQERLPAGSLFALPARVPLDVVNDPDPRNGRYQSLIIEVTPEMTADGPPAAAAASGAGAAIALRPELVEAVVHAAAAIAEGPAAAPVRRARVAELLALLAEEPAAGVLFDLSAADRVAQLIRTRPEHAWRSDVVARSLGMSEATLRRRLREDGSGFSVILRRERMSVARRLLERGMASGLAAAAVGYASRTHFARAYRATFGRNPAQGG